MLGSSIHLGHGHGAAGIGKQYAYSSRWNNMCSDLGPGQFHPLIPKQLPPKRVDD